MDLLEIRLKNPIGQDQIVGLKSQLIEARPYDYLIIDMDGYDFTSREVHKQFNDLLSDLEPCLMKFRKIMLIHTPLIYQDSLSPYRYHLCISRQKAIAWLNSGTE